MSEPDLINHPPHYTHSSIEPIDVIESWGLGFHLGNALKYIARAGHKDDLVRDLQKARWYIERAIAAFEADEANQPGYKPHMPFTGLRSSCDP